MQVKLADLRKGEVSSSDTQRSEERRTQKAIRTWEYKLDRVSHKIQYHKIPWKQTDHLPLSCRSYIVVLCHTIVLVFKNCIYSHNILLYYIILKFAYVLYSFSGFDSLQWATDQKQPAEEGVADSSYRACPFPATAKQTGQGQRSHHGWFRDKGTHNFFCLASLLFSLFYKYLHFKKQTCLCTDSCRNCTMSARRSGE